MLQYLKYSACISNTVCLEWRPDACLRLFKNIGYGKNKQTKNLISSIWNPVISSATPPKKTGRMVVGLKLNRRGLLKRKKTNSHLFFGNYTHYLRQENEISTCPACTPWPAEDWTRWDPVSHCRAGEAPVVGSACFSSGNQLFYTLWCENP